jgi:hypothetical protein
MENIRPLELQPHLVPLIIPGAGLRPSKRKAGTPFARGIAIASVYLAQVLIDRSAFFATILFFFLTCARV